MKYLYGFESFKEGKINEGILGSFFGGLFDSLKNKLSLSLSKEFGNAKKADEILDQYKKEAMQSATQKFTLLKAMAEYMKTAKADGEVDNDKIKKMQQDIKKTDDLFTQSMGTLKEKYDLKLKDVIDEEKNKKITNYIQIKKLEMKQEILAKEMQILQEVGLDEETMNDEKGPFKEMLANIKTQTDEANNNIKKNEKRIRDTNDVTKGFDFEAARKAATTEGEQYVWKNPPEVGVGDKILYFSKEASRKEGEEYKGSEAEVTKIISKDKVDVKTDTSEAGFTINKGKIISNMSNKEENPEVVDDVKDKVQTEIEI